MQGNINFELEKLRTELRHVRGMYAIAQKEAMDASRKVSLRVFCPFSGQNKTYERIKGITCTVS